MSNISLIVLVSVSACALLPIAAHAEHTERLADEMRNTSKKMKKAIAKAEEKAYIEAQRENLWREHIERG